MRGVGAPVAALEEFPILALDLRAAQPAERDAGLAHAPPLLADDLAPLVVEAREKVVEIGIPLVYPMKLHRTAQHHPCVLQQLRFRRTWKQHVQRGEVARRLERGGRERL